MTTAAHLGHNIRSIRLLQGMKQETFALKMGISQQWLSKLERQKEIPPDKLQAAAQALGVSVKAIETFDEKSVLGISAELSAKSVEPTFKEVMDYLMTELFRRDRKIEMLENELTQYRKEGIDQEQNKP